MKLFDINKLGLNLNKFIKQQGGLIYCTTWGMDFDEIMINHSPSTADLVFRFYNSKRSLTASYSMNYIKVIHNPNDIIRLLLESVGYVDLTNNHLYKLIKK